MDLVAVGHPSEVRDAFTQMRHALRHGASKYRRTVGYQGGGGEYDVYWRPAQAFWSLLRPIENRYWCCYGTVDPTGQSSLPITCEANPAKAGVPRQMAGMFARDAVGRVYITHSGKIGGGRKGIGMEGFYRHYRGQDAIQQAAMPDGRTRRVVVIGRVNDSGLPTLMGQFVHEVERIKGVLSASSEGTGPALRTLAEFTPEFVGKKYYKPEGDIEARCDHGLVVQALANALESVGVKVGNDQNRDLFAVENGRVSVLFEVKTGLTTSNIYGGVGQLMLHSAVQDPPPSRVLVLPGEPSKATRTALAVLQIDVLVYAWKGNTPLLPDVACFVRQR